MSQHSQASTATSGSLTRAINYLPVDEVIISIIRAAKTVEDLHVVGRFIVMVGGVTSQGWETIGAVWDRKKYDCPRTATEYMEDVLRIINTKKDVAGQQEADVIYS